jgi:hypothetical protein
VVFPSSLCGVGCDKRSCSGLGIFVVCCVGNLDIYLSVYIFRYRLAFCMTCDGRAVWSAIARACLGVCRIASGLQIKSHPYRTGPVASLA